MNEDSLKIEIYELLKEWKNDERRFFENRDI
jgi:hypothetical protein